jgi:16S rRNA (uracil1498-N3)-methyltransferase
MNMEHYYTPKIYISASSLIIIDDEAKHLARSLRKKSGEEINVTDGEGNLYRCKIDKISKDRIDCNILSKSFGLSEPEIKVTLYQSLLKNPDRFEFAIEKSVELGVNMIQPIITEHVINKEREKTERWQAIALAAMKQSQRSFMPTVQKPVSFDEAVKNCKDGIKLIAHEKDCELLIGDCGIKESANVAFFIGPEGGFSDAEINLALESGFKLITLGKRKYRSETAAVAALSLILL